MGNPDKRSHDKVFSYMEKKRAGALCKGFRAEGRTPFYSSIVSPGVMRSVFFAWNLAGSALNQ